MKSSILLRNFACISTVTLLAVAAMAPVGVLADNWNGLPSNPSWGGGAPSAAAENQQAQQAQDSQRNGGDPQTQQMFASPDDAVKALRAAVEANDRTALGQIFGPLFQSLQTGDKVQDANNARHFANAMAERCRLEKAGDNEFFVDVGTNAWPMSVPLVETNGQWFFNTAAGKEEIINRHIGRDELTAIGVCRDYVKAQRQFATMNDGVFAQKFKSSPGKKDGLYWPAREGEEPSPFGALVAEAHMEGYGGHHGGGPHAFQGYYFRILTEQGKAAPGGRKDYVNDGQLKNGFALLAYPENWNQSGMMTFIVNQDGKVYQQDLGEKTDRIAPRIKEYNPDKNWTLVQDEGILDAVSSK
jgi:hypothetical protein